MDREQAVERIARAADAMGMAPDLVEPLLQAIEVSGLELREREGGRPIDATRVVPGERLRLQGMPNRYVCGVRVAGGWICWAEFWRKREHGGPFITQPVFVPTSGDLVAAHDDGRMELRLVGTSEGGSQ